MVTGNGSAAKAGEAKTPAHINSETQERSRVIICVPGLGERRGVSPTWKLSNICGRPRRVYASTFAYLQVKSHRFAAEFDSLRRRIAPDDFDPENAIAARPSLHPHVASHCQSARLVIPLESEPDGLRIGAVAVPESRAVVVVKRKATVHARVDPQRRRLRHRLRRVLPHRIERDDGAGADVNRHGREVHEPVEPLPALDNLSPPPFVSGSRGQIESA